MTTFEVTRNWRTWLRFGILSMLATLLSSAPAVAAPADDDGAVRYRRKRGKVEVKSTLDTRFRRAKAKVMENDGPPRDQIGADDYARKRTAAKLAIIDDQIEVMKRMIRASSLKDPDFPDLLFRLADLHLDRKAYFELQAGALYGKIHEAREAGKTDLVRRRVGKQRRFKAAAKESGKQAVRAYAELIKEPAFARYKRLDEALFYFAFELGQLGREGDMKDAYLRLIRDYPRSPYVPNAFLSFADYYFGRGEVGDALKLYEKVIVGYPDSPVYAYALYKSAWCHLNPVGTAAPAYDKSLQRFVDTIKATLAGRAGNEANARHLRRDARRDLIRAYLHVGKPSRAWEFFTKVGNGPKREENQAKDMMQRLAVAYFGEGMYVESSAIYKRLQGLYEADASGCEWQRSIVINALASDDKNIQWRETKRLTSYWDKFRAGKYSKTIKRKCRNDARDLVRQMATVWHDEADKTHRPATYELAESAYRQYLETFPKERDAYDMQYWYAEIKWARAEELRKSRSDKAKRAGLEKFREAYDEFVKLLEDHKRGKHTQAAAYAQMLAMKNFLDYDETGGKAKACRINSEGVCVYSTGRHRRPRVGRRGRAGGDAAANYPRSDYTDDEAQMLKAYDRYTKFVKAKNDKQLPKILYHRAKLAVDHNRFDDARPSLEKLVTKFDGTSYAVWSAEMLIDLLTIRWQDSGNTPKQTLAASAELEKWARKVKRTKSYKHSEGDRLRTGIPELLAGIRWRKAETYRLQGAQGDPEGFKKCATEYVEIYNDYGNHDRSDDLLFNAARCYDAAYLLGRAIEMRRELLSRHPSSKVAKQTLLELAQNYRSIAFFDSSAKHYESYAKKYPRDKASDEALRNAYLFRLGLGDDKQAEHDLDAYERIYRKKDRSMAARIFWSRHALLQSDQARMRHAREYISSYGKNGGVDRKIVAEATIGQIQWRQSCNKKLLYDSCISIRRRKATTGERTRERADDLRRRNQRRRRRARLPKFCGSSTKAIITVHERDRGKAKLAQARFAEVIRLARKGVKTPGDDIERRDAYREAVGMAMVYRADQKYEEYLGIEMPTGLSFLLEPWKKDSGLARDRKQYKAQLRAREDSLKRVGAYFKSKLALAQELEKAYTSVGDSKSPPWVLAGAARAAVVYQNFADQLYRAPVSREIKTEQGYNAYCDELADRAGKLEKKAVAALKYCLGRSTKYQYFNRFSRMCEEELQQRDPDAYPATNELFGRSRYTASRPDVVGVQTDLRGDVRLADPAKRKSPSE